MPYVGCYNIACTDTYYTVEVQVQDCLIECGHNVYKKARAFCECVFEKTVYRGESVSDELYCNNIGKRIVKSQKNIELKISDLYMFCNKQNNITDKFIFFGRFFFIFDFYRCVFYKTAPAACGSFGPGIESELQL